MLRKVGRTPACLTKHVVLDMTGKRLWVQGMCSGSVVLAAWSAVTQNMSLRMVPIRKLKSQKWLRVRRICKG